VTSGIEGGTTDTINQEFAGQSTLGFTFLLALAPTLLKIEHSCFTGEKPRCRLFAFCSPGVAI
jgi:hypothetical protein